jgi:hypothetical protein
VGIPLPGPEVASGFAPPIRVFFLLSSLAVSAVKAGEKRPVLIVHDEQERG